jgi:hypothetical protein
MAPGKGVHAVLNQEVLDFVKACLEDIESCYSDEIHDSEPIDVINTLKGWDRDEDEKWSELKDNFGHKVFRIMPYKDQELRVTVVLTKQGELRLDIRQWYDPQA